MFQGCTKVDNGQDNADNKNSIRPIGNAHSFGVTEFTVKTGHQFTVQLQVLRTF